MTDLDRFRSEARNWLQDNCPPSMRTPPGDGNIPRGGRVPEEVSEDALVWLDAMREKRWVAPAWPVEYGGGGLSPAEMGVLREELVRISARAPIISIGLMMFGPMLLEFGTEEQKLRFLPDIAAGRVRWCQGFSEPGAGSDLASLQTRCEDKGDHWLINGQKIWTTFADVSDWLFCLVRTDRQAPKWEGISMVLIDMRSDGVEARPIELISGASIFCETFLTDVKVPKDLMVGPLNSGWTIAKRLLQHERSAIGTGRQRNEGMAHDAVLTLRQEDDAPMDAGMRARLAGIEIDELAIAATTAQLGAEIAAGNNRPFIESLLKVASCNIRQNRSELIAHSMGSRALSLDDTILPAENDARTTWLRNRALSIEGGSTEINLNIVAERLLQLPRSS
jgi:alkylation response protein AidB-like acyl-CoA dehydrogenase